MPDGFDLVRKEAAGVHVLANEVKEQVGTVGQLVWVVLAISLLTLC